MSSLQVDGRLCGDIFFFFQAEDGIRYLVRSRGLGDVYKRQVTTTVLYDLMIMADWIAVLALMEH